MSEVSQPIPPPVPAYDAAEVAAAARRADPGLPPETADLLAGEAGRHLAGAGDLVAPEVARLLLASHPESGASAAAVVARAAVERGAVED